VTIRVAAAAAAAALLLAGGCASDPAEGWSFRSTWPESIRTVAVDVFRNDSFDRDVAFELADALVKEIEARTPYKVTGARDADTILTGRIRAVDRQQLSKSTLSGLSEEVTIRVTIDLEWRHLQTGESILTLESFTSHGLFLPSRPSGEPMELGEFAAVQKLAREIVDQMRAPW
jgi:hypothetical protein